MPERLEFSLEPMTENCASVCERREHVVVGVSPGNSFFRVPLLADLIHWLNSRFARMDIIVPDAELAPTFMALGYSPERAAGKARGEVNAVRNRIVRAWESLGGPRPGDGLHLMSELVDRPQYLTARRRCEKALAVDGNLRTACQNASRTVLLARRPEKEPTAREIEQGMRYLLAELPFFVASADIFGVPSSLCFYHRPLPLAALIFSGRTVLKPTLRQAYALIRPTGLPHSREHGKAGHVSSETATPADPYTNLADSYDRLAEWAVTCQKESPRDRVADFLQTFWQSQQRPVRTVLEICCGTGLMLGELARRGYAVTGLDRSAAMLERARRRLGEETTLIHAALPHIPAEAGPFDAVVSAAGGLNYLPEEQISATFAAVARALPAGGTFTFDVFGRGFFRKFFDSSAPRVMALELDDIAYIWTFTASPEAPFVDMAYTQFTPAPAADGGEPPFLRTRDLHRYYPLPHTTVRRLAAEHGFTDIKAYDNYSTDPSGPDSLYDTWTMVRSSS
ncbi:tRNA-dependent cyclodipeptide synthase [Streptomyces albus]|uniref:tRNA-dependent cyclodipeptide synthase n=1 Tax=Streptomyces albus TaxID=1888 RepID=UPI0024AD4AB9|nr:tRNA-dependent cyclodipeptide synthase [Streptomyces albus]MDI6413591.1 tRNA-dependent cyclodipeptide synthase [Streptomyces albus]